MARKEETDIDPTADPIRDGNFVRSLERGLEVIQTLSTPGPGLTLTDVAERTGLSRAAARRFLITLERLGYVRMNGRMFVLAPRVLNLGYAYLSSLSLPEIAHPHLERLSAKVNESCSISVLDEDEIVYVARMPAAWRAMSLMIRVGTRLPAYATSMGRVLLAGLPPERFEEFLERVELASLTSNTITDKERLRAEVDRVRKQGFAIVDQEREQGLRSAAAPIGDATGQVVAAVNVSVLAGRTPLKVVRKELVPAVMETAAAITQDLASDTPLATGSLARS
jgi:IclR family pca regulon transcriptional regulator